MATVLSRPFKLAEWKLYSVPDEDPRRWAPVRDPDETGRDADSFVPIRDKWVYVFLQWGTEFAVLHEELYVDESSQIHPVDMTQAREKERDRRPAQGPSSGSLHSLPVTISGNRAYYYFLSSRIRLPLEPLRKLQSRVHGLLPAADLAVTGLSNLEVDKELVVGVTDPILVALNLNRRYQKAQDEVLGFTTVFPEQSSEQRAWVERTQKKRLLAQLLTSVRDQDPDDKLDLQDDFKAGGEAEMRRFLAEYEKTLKKKIEKSDRAAASVCSWLNGELMDILAGAYEIFKTDDFHKYLNSFSGCIARLQESAPGKAYLAGILENPNHFGHEYVLRKSAAPEDVFQVGRKSATAIVEIWKELAHVHIALRGSRSITVLVKSLEFISRSPLLTVGIASRSLPVWREPRHLVFPKEIITLKLGPEPSRWAEWMHDGHSVGELAERLLVIVEVINLALALKGLAEAEGGHEVLLHAFEALLAGAESVRAFGMLLHLTEKTLAVVGSVAAVLELICAGLEAAEYAHRNDYSAMVGYGVVGVGSVLSAIGCTMVALGAAAGTSVVGLPLGVFLGLVGAVTIAAGWVVAAFSKDSDIELFVQHCLWGEDYGSGDAAPPWAGGPFRDWKDNLDRQIAALVNILSSFTIEATDYAAVRISLGVVRPESKVHFKFEALYHPGIRRRSHVIVNLQDGQMTQADGDPVDLTRVPLETHPTGQSYVEVTATPKFDDYESERVGALQKSICEVYLELDESHRIPGSGAWVPYKISELGRGIVDSEVVSSKNF